MNKTKASEKIVKKISSWSFLSGVNLKAIFISIFGFINGVIISLAYLVLVAQTIVILSGKEQKYINLRHLAIKWLICLLISQIERAFASKSGLTEEIIKIGLNLIVLWFAYPTQLLKTVHLKYFSHKETQRYNQSVDDPNNYDITFGNKILVTIVVGCLNITKFIITFVPPPNRKSIQDALKATNQVVIKKKCFWNIYDDKKVSPKDSFAEGDYLGQENMKTSQIIGRNADYEDRDVIKAYGEEVLENMGRSSVQRIFKPLRNVKITYYSSSSIFEVTSIETNHAERYTLEQMAAVASKVMQFVVLKAGDIYHSRIYIKFSTDRQLDSFYNRVDQVEKNV